MILSLSAMTALALQCAPGVAPETLLSVVQVESGFDPFVVAVNGSPRQVFRPETAGAATALAGQLIAAGEDVDLGLGQINGRNLARLGLSVEGAFDPCLNLAASGRLLLEGYRRADAAPGAEQAALRTAFSLYNTGHPRRGFENGYVARVTRAAGKLVPAIRVGLGGAAATPAPAPLPEPPPDLSRDAFARARVVAVF